MNSFVKKPPQWFTLANFLTAARLTGAFCLLMLEPLSASFFAVYAFCGVSDALDGPIARYTNTQSDFGSRLDSVADLAFYIILMQRLLSRMLEQLPLWMWTWMSAVLALRLVNYLTVALLFHRFAANHTKLNKLTGFMLFAVPVMLATPYFVEYCMVLGGVSTVAVFYEVRLNYAELKTAKQ